MSCCLTVIGADLLATLGLRCALPHCGAFAPLGRQLNFRDWAADED